MLLRYAWNQCVWLDSTGFMDKYNSVISVLLDCIFLDKECIFLSNEDTFDQINSKVGDMKWVIAVTGT